MSGLIPDLKLRSTPDFGKRLALILLGWVWLFVLGVGLLGPVFAPYDPHQTNPLYQFAIPSYQHWLGTDAYGRDILSRFLWGTRTSLAEALFAVLVAGAFGMVLSLFALFGYQRLDRVAGYVLDALLAFPGLLTALIMITLLGRGPLQISLAVGISLAPACARLIRSSIAAVKNQPYVSAAYALGASRWWIVRRHFLRNISYPMLSFAAVVLAWSLLDSAALEFLGLAGSLENPTWGSMIGEGRAYFREAVWGVLGPSLFLCLTVLGLTLAANRSQLQSNDHQQ
jgi:peptide/nickel transport system permease protein